MLLGAAILGAVAAKKYSGLQDAMKALNAAGQVRNHIKIILPFLLILLVHLINFETCLRLFLVYDLANFFLEI